MAFIFTKYRQHIAVLLFLLFGLLIANTAFNRHSHFYRGSTISHAHPYDRNDSSPSPFKSHQHSDAEFIILNLITNLQVITSLVIYLTAILILIREIGMIPEKASFQLLPYSVQKNRAPPSSA